MVVSTLILYALYLLLLFGVQSLLQQKETGTSGWLRRLGYTPAEHAANLLFLIGVGLDLAGPILVLAGIISPATLLDTPAFHVVGLFIFGLGSASALVARHEMGTAWRTGIDPAAAASAPLVIHGLFAVVRNPVYAAMILVSIAVALLVPTIATLTAVVLGVVALEVQTRLVEEPFLHRVYGGRYDEYAHHVGRFVPLIGRWTRG